jgi:hypothetical protein
MHLVWSARSDGSDSGLPEIQRATGLPLSSTSTAVPRVTIAWYSSASPPMYELLVTWTSRVSVEGFSPRMNFATACASASTPTDSAQAPSLSESAARTATSFSRSQTVLRWVETERVVLLGTSVGGVNGSGPGSDAF